MNKIIEFKCNRRNEVKHMQANEDARKISLEDSKQLLKIILFFTAHSRNLIYKTKLNKLLFYSQFMYFKEHKNSLISQTFIKDYYGPVVDGLDEILSQFNKLGILDVVTTNYGEVVKSSIKISDMNYTDEEIDVLMKVLRKFDSYTSREISDYSHKEILWLNANYKEVINVEEAYLLNEF